LEGWWAWQGPTSPTAGGGEGSAASSGRTSPEEKKWIRDEGREKKDPNAKANDITCRLSVIIKDNDVRTTPAGTRTLEDDPRAWGLLVARPPVSIALMKRSLLCGGKLMSPMASSMAFCLSASCDSSAAGRLLPLDAIAIRRRGSGASSYGRPRNQKGKQMEVWGCGDEEEEREALYRCGGFNLSAAVCIGNCSSTFITPTTSTRLHDAREIEEPPNRTQKPNRLLSTMTLKRLDCHRAK
jgi:hypothetical protein